LSSYLNNSNPLSRRAHESHRLLRSLPDILRKKCGTIKVAEVALPELYNKHAQVTRKIYTIKKPLRRAVLASSRSTWFEKVDQEIKQQLRGGPPSAFIFDCQFGLLVSESFSGSGDHIWVNAVGALVSLCNQKVLRYKNICLFCLTDTSLRLCEREHLFHTAGTLRMYIERMYSASFTSLVVECPFKCIDDKFDHRDRLKHHLAVVHNIKL